MYVDKRTKSAKESEGPLSGTPPACELVKEGGLEFPDTEMARFRCILGVVGAFGVDVAARLLNCVTTVVYCTGETNTNNESIIRSSGTHNK